MRRSPRHRSPWYEPGKTIILPENVTMLRTHLGKPVVAIRFDGPTPYLLADHNAPDWMVTAAARLGSLLTEQVQRLTAPCPRRRP